MSISQEFGLSIKIIYDNKSYNSQLQEGWGLSLLISYKKANILFDTGSCSEAFFANIEKMGVPLNDITHVMISHKHFDHSAGLPQVLEKVQPGTHVYLPKLFASPFFKRKFPLLHMNVISSFSKIEEGIYSLVMKGGFLLYEQALLLSTPKGIVVITGCAHPGIVAILRKTKELFPSSPLYFVLGGLHLFSTSPYLSREIVQFFQSEGVEKVAPCHCSGDHLIRQFQEAYGKDFFSIGTGSHLVL